MTYDPPAGERRAADRGRRAMLESETFNGAGPERSCRSGRWNPALIVNPENLAPCCDHRFLRTAPSLPFNEVIPCPKRARLFTAPIHSKIEAAVAGPEQRDVCRISCSTRIIPYRKP